MKHFKGGEGALVLGTEILGMQNFKKKKKSDVCNTDYILYYTDCTKTFEIL